MSGDYSSTADLVISGGGRTAIASDELFAHAQELEKVGMESLSCARQLAGVDGILDGARLRAAQAPPSAFEAEAAIAAATATLDELERAAALVARLLRMSADAYGGAERFAANAMHDLAARLGYSVGFYLPIIALAIAPSVAVALGGVVLLASLSPGGLRGFTGGLGEWFRVNTRALIDPMNVALIKLGVSSADDFGAGMLHVPPGVVHALGDDGLGVLGTGTTAAAVALVGQQVGIFAETPVTATRVSRATGAAPPATLVDRIDRLPDTGENTYGEQIVIDRIEVAGQPDRFEVYIAGTADFTSVGQSEAFDMTSNVFGVADLPAGSYRATQLAMEQAGITRHTPVVFTGHSQGGLIAATLAASGDYNVRGVVAIGAPTAHVDVPASIPMIAIEHTDDLVPALSGMRTDTSTIVVERRAFAPGADLGDSPLPPHEKSAYRATAALVDRAHNDQVREAIRAMSYRGDATVTTTSYLAERVP